MSIWVDNVQKRFGTQLALDGVELRIGKGEVVGLLGPNGAGKSTQMRLIAGHEEPTSGQVVRQGEPRIAYLQQEFDVDLERTVRQELFQAFGEAAEVMNQQQQVEEAMGSERAAEDPDHLDQLNPRTGKAAKPFRSTAWLRTRCPHRQAPAHDRLHPGGR